MKEIRIQYKYQLIDRNGETEEISGYSKLELFLEGIAENSRRGVIRNLDYSIEYIN